MVQSEGKAINVSRQRLHTCVAEMSSLEDERYIGINARTSGGRERIPAKVSIGVCIVEMTRRTSDFAKSGYDELDINRWHEERGTKAGIHTRSTSVYNLPETICSESSTPRAYISCGTVKLRPGYFLCKVLMNEMRRYGGRGKSAELSVREFNVGVETTTGATFRADRAGAPFTHTRRNQAPECLAGDLE